MNVQALLQLTVQQCDLDYHTSAILAAALDTMTMPFRQETGPIHLSDVTSALSPLGRKVSCHCWLSDEDGSIKILVSKVVVGFRCGMQVINNNDNFCRALFSKARS